MRCFGVRVAAAHLCLRPAMRKKRMSLQNFVMCRIKMPVILMVLQLVRAKLNNLQMPAPIFRLFKIMSVWIMRE